MFNRSLQSLVVRFVVNGVDCLHDLASHSLDVEYGVEIEKSRYEIG